MNPITTEIPEPIDPEDDFILRLALTTISGQLHHISVQLEEIASQGRPPSRRTYV